MIVNILISSLLFLYFTFIGKYILNKLSITRSLSFATGLIVMNSLMYIFTSILTALSTNVYITYSIYTALFLVGLSLIIKSKSYLLNKMEIVSASILAICVVILSFYSYNTSLGNLYGFDSEFYLGFISTNSIAKHFNEISTSNGFRVDYYNDYVYAFQTYMYFMSYVLKITRYVFSIVGYTVNNLSFIFWVGQILFDMLFVSLIINTIYILKNNNIIFYCFIFIICIMFFGRWYYNNVFGFFGNTFRSIIFGYAILEFYNYSKDINNEKYLFYTSIIASCAFSSSSIFILVFLLFGILFVLQSNKRIFKEYALVLFFPIVNLSANFWHSIIRAVLFSLLISFVLFVSNDLLLKIFENKKRKIILLMLATISMAILSYTTSGKLINIDAYLAKEYINADMMFSYLDVFGTNINNIYSLVFLALFIIYIVFNTKNSLSIAFCAILIAILNPLCCSFLANVNSVYYRTYDIMFNPCTFIIYVDFFTKLIKTKAIANLILIIVSIVFILKMNIFKPIYFHSSFVPKDGFDGVLRMTKDEYDVIMFIKDDYQYNDIEIPFIANNNLLTQTMIPQGKYLFSRIYRANMFNDSCKKVSRIFASKDLMDVYIEDSWYLELEDVIKESGINYLVVDKKSEFYDEENGYYNYLYLKVEEFEFDNIYENDSYVVFVYY